MNNFPRLLHPLCLMVLCLSTIFAQDEGTRTDWLQQQPELQKQRRQQLEQLTQMIEENPERLDLYSRRGDLSFFLGDSEQAVSDYDKMVELSPSIDASHWRRGIALFYTGKYKEAAAQFDRYHSFDDVDRENGIWRYLSHYKAFGKEKARAELLKYEKDDREPFPSVYKLFAGKIAPEQILKEIETAEISEPQRESRIFYASLYIGMNYVVEEKPELAKKTLKKMLGNTWGPKAGYGPNFMWEVGRLQYELLQSQTSKDESGMGISNSKSTSE
ncbi:MAG: hypothetical protein HUJ26_24830 [Planctomycetaceae bacterium]|nr:hypothetical protein [Planctomycetaceae bacterium]